jgi:hypothetical protein
MTVRIRYKPNNSDFGKLMMSSQTQDLADEAAGRGVLVAIAYAQSAHLPSAYITGIGKEVGPPVVLQGNPRRTARVTAPMPWIEFGSGRLARGASRGRSAGRGGRKRPQGGYSKPYRILGKTGSRIGSPPGGKA